MGIPEEITIPNLTPGTKVHYIFKTFNADGSESNQELTMIMMMDHHPRGTSPEQNEHVFHKVGSTSGSMTVSESGDSVVHGSFPTVELGPSQCVSNNFTVFADQKKPETFM